MYFVKVILYNKIIIVGKYLDTMQNNFEIEQNSKKINSCNGEYQGKIRKKQVVYKTKNASF